MKTIESIRNKDPRIYDKNSKWYTSEPSSEDSDKNSEEEQNGEGSNKSSKKKKTFKDVLREQLLRGEVGDEEEDSEIEGKKHRIEKKSALQYDAEQEELRRNFLKSANEIENSDDNNENDNSDNDNDDGDDLFVQAKKDPKLVAQEESELLKKIENYGKTSTEEDQFLANYMKEKKWVDNLSKSIKLSKDTHMTEEVENQLLDLEEDEKDLIEIDKFESKYNFRFEELQNGICFYLYPFIISFRYHYNV